MKSNNKKWLYLVAVLVFLSGILTLSSTLFSLSHLHNVRIVLADAHLTVIAGISLIYLATLLKRGKYNAWLVAVGVSLYLIARNFEHFIIDRNLSEHLLPVVLNLGIPIITLAGLFVFRSQYVVKSEPRSFIIAFKRSLLVLSIAFIYGVVGFQLFDMRDFNQEISITSAAHFTIDQYGITTPKALEAHTKRGVFFVDSLAAVSLMALLYTGISFFAPIKFKLTGHSSERLMAYKLSKKYSLTSEDYFKFWPLDKEYYFSENRTAFLAYRVVRGVALVVGDPVGPEGGIKSLIVSFQEYCRLNDWAVSFIHVSGELIATYSKLGFSEQKIGEEAFVDLGHFVTSVAKNKYFRHINNKFSKLGYRCELISPPFSDDIIKQLKNISDDWLKKPGRAERGFMLGYFTRAYIQQCDLMVLYDEAGLIKGFINQVPTIVKNEANYDLLRHTADCPGNANDYLMMSFIRQLHEQGYKKLNMGLCPLSGLKPEDETDRSIINGLLNFIYANAGRFYSFQGLRRFKSKYEPVWATRYIISRGGVAGLTRTANSLLRAMTHFNSHHG